MFKKLSYLMIVGLLINLMTVNFAYADSKEEKAARFTEKIKKGILSLGTGEQARIEVKLRDNTKLKGYVKEAGNETFTIVDAKSGVETTTEYPQVKQVKGNNLSTDAKVIIGIGVALAIALFIVFKADLLK